MLFEAQRLFESVQIFGVKDCGQRSAIDRAFGCHRILAHISCVRNLLCKYYDFQTHKNYIVLLVSQNVPRHHRAAGHTIVIYAKVIFFSLMTKKKALKLRIS